jgi:hypothetical protein
MSHTSPLRIAVISEHASPLAAIGGVDAGGQNIYVAKTAECLARMGHEVDVFTRREDTVLPTVIHVAPRLRVIQVDAGPPEPVAKEGLLPHMPAFAAFVERQARRFGGYDIAHANFFMSGWVARELKRSIGLPYVITFHALGCVRQLHQREADAFPAERLAIEEELASGPDGADMVIAECPQDRRDLMRCCHVPAHRLRTVPCGVDLGELAPQSRSDARAALGMQHDDFVVLQLGRLVPRKGIDNVIQAFARLARAGRSAQLVIVGGDHREPSKMRSPELDRLRGLAHVLQVADRVRFVGQRRRDELAQWYAASDVFVTTPWYEPFGITPLEAMACERPVIGSRVGGIQHTVVDGRTGYLVEPRDPQALAARLEQLRGDPVLAATLGHAGGQRVRRGYTWQQVAVALDAVYADVLRRASDPQGVATLHALRASTSLGSAHAI